MKHPCISISGFLLKTIPINCFIQTVKTFLFGLRPSIATKSNLISGNTSTGVGFIILTAEVFSSTIRDLYSTAGDSPSTAGDSSSTAGDSSSTTGDSSSTSGDSSSTAGDSSSTSGDSSSTAGDSSSTAGKAYATIVKFYTTMLIRSLDIAGQFSISHYLQAKPRTRLAVWRAF